MNDESRCLPVVLCVVCLLIVACDESDNEPAVSAEEQPPAVAETGDEPAVSAEDEAPAVAESSVDDEAGDDHDAQSDDQPVALQQDDETTRYESFEDVDAVLEAICDERVPCHEMNRWEAGAVDETSLTVFEVALHDRGKEGRTPDLYDCAPFEYWLVESRDAEMVDHTRLQRVCNDGYGARGIGEDNVEVDDNTFIYSQRGGSSWMWTIRVVVQLAPLRVIENHSTGSWIHDVNRRSEFWDWTRPAGRVEWTAPHCDERKTDDDRGTESRHDEYRFDYLMEIEMDASFRNGGWKTTHLEDCSLRVDSRGNDTTGDDEEFGSGYVIHGEPTEPDEASFRAVMDSDSTLYLEIRDTEWFTGADRWIHDDHLEVWLGPATGYTDHCLEPDDPSQWGIGLFDDEIFPGYNDPDPEALEIERHLVGEADDPEAVRLKIEFASSPDALTIVYSDTEDGNSQDRLIATSDLRHGDAASLGKTRQISSDEARCTVEEGELVFDDLRQFESAATVP